MRAVPKSSAAAQTSQHSMFSVRFGPVVFITVCVGATVMVANASEGGGPRLSSSPPSELELQLDRARRYNRKLERLLHREVSRAERNERILRRSRTRIRRVLGTSPLGNHWLENAFLCVKSYEGRWNDRGDPYWGGLQMDWSFMRTYGREYVQFWGPASNWPRSVQIAVAIKAWISRGFGPWPTTRRYCGL
jgi:hypothetical protein